ncbi:Phosphatidylinositol 4-phosphate 5-kinase-like protein 1 [Liparis tanakae]|uniref:Phosphatidylinositol 4-phosphate 5-kinase-like protein 1 n=1 Tax=Liparis tanakae TaxID=230148 RepID=A0A4Z2EWH2_9TELE|nr:Phosphatidylinositol 4-phosphate 5-kinase-like protein 1 [Liparis tanakae]
MQSVFYPDDRINARYDFKGCEVSRWTAPPPEGSRVVVVLKDLNFEGQHIVLDQQRPWLLRQVDLDSRSVGPGSSLVPEGPPPPEPSGGAPELPDFRVQNRRLLPDLESPLHVIDGPERRYLVGIVDVFTVYGVRKRMERWLKSLRYPGRSFSTASPPLYRRRLLLWLQDHTK